MYQLTKNLTEDEIKINGFEDYFVDHTTGVFPQSAGGIPFSAAALQVKGDLITDLHEDMAAEQKARTTYDNILRFCDDHDVKDAIRFLREREIVHYQRFGEAKRTKYSGLIMVINNKRRVAFWVTRLFLMHSMRGAATLRTSEHFICDFILYL